MTEAAKQVQIMAEQIQEECHNSVVRVMETQKQITVQDATNAYLFTKLAELQLQISQVSTALYKNL